MTTPIITIDGPSASGKGTVAKLVASALGFHYLDSGAIYRLCAYYAQQQGVAWDDETGVAQLASAMDIAFYDDQIWLGKRSVEDQIRTEDIGKGASLIAALPAVRQALLAKQQAFQQPPGLVADGRDMGTTVFPAALLKIFLIASAEARAKRRYKQLMDKGESVNLRDIKADIDLRDARDTQRSLSPLRPAPEARILDTTDIGAQQAADFILTWYRTLQANH